MSELWREFLSRDGLCGLCGNWGVVITEVRSPAGVACGVERFCICPNGRAWKDGGADLGALSARAKGSDR